MDTTLQDTERALIGAVLLSGGRVLDELVLDAADFWSTQASEVYRLTEELHRLGKPVDPITVMDLARRDPATARLADAGWLQECMLWAPGIGAAPYHAEIRRGASVRRRLRNAGQKIMDTADNDALNVSDAIELARRTVEDAANIQISEIKSFGETIDSTLSMLEEKPNYRPTPWGQLDGIIGGFAPGRLYVVGARPAAGKTAFALQAALNLKRYGGVAFSSLEMSNEELQMRAIAYVLKIDQYRLQHRRLSTEDWEKIALKRQAWDELPLYIDERSSVTIAEIKAHARNVARKGPLAAVVVDYLQLVSSPASNRNRTEVVSEISRELKIMAKQLKVPVIALSQLNRESENRQDPRPALKDLRESGAIEQDADVVILLHRDRTDPSALTMIVAKNRHGVTGEADFEFIGKFSEISQGGRNVPEPKRTPPTLPGMGNPFIDRTANDD
jgi:replicative DNA helicase